jgi:hypothetical protein
MHTKNDFGLSSGRIFGFGPNRRRVLTCYIFYSDCRFRHYPGFIEMNNFNEQARPRPTATPPEPPRCRHCGEYLHRAHLCRVIRKWVFDGRKK